MAAIRESVSQTAVIPSTVEIAPGMSALAKEACLGRDVIGSRPSPLARLDASGGVPITVVNRSTEDSGTECAFSALTLARQAVSRNRGWSRQWRAAAPAPAYDALIVGGGGHGLATSYYLAKEHGLERIAVLEKGWIGGGNVGRNTTIIRSNYMLPRIAASTRRA